MLKLYLDNCCYNRPFDDMGSFRVKSEADAVMAILSMGERKEIQIIGSDILEYEMSKMHDFARLEKVKMLYQVSSTSINYSTEIRENAIRLQDENHIRLYDSLHLAGAINGKADYFLTTDDKLIKACHSINYNICVMNPLQWVMEVGI